MIYLNNNKIQDVYLGNTPINKIYRGGGELVFNKENESIIEIINNSDYITITTIVNNGVTNVVQYATYPTINDEVTKIKINNIQSFYNQLQLKYVDLSKYIHYNGYDLCLDNLFNECTNLLKVNLSNIKKFDGGVSLAFNNCSLLQKIDLSNLDATTWNNLYPTSALNKMFYNCQSLNHIKCKQSFKDWCLQKRNAISLPIQMQDGGSGTWEIID